MVQDGFPMAAATMADWHQAACGMIEPLYGGTLSDSVSLGDNRNPRLPRQHTHNKCGRGKADIMDNLKDWTGLLYFSILLLSSQLF